MFKILSIDGGGIKGLYSSIILNEIEKIHGKINEHFDLICGTSTGGLIALAIAADIPLKKIIDFFKNKGPEIFPSQNWLKRKFHECKQLCFSTKYNNKILKNTLNDIYGDKLLDHAKICLCIPAVDLANFRGIVFKTSHDSELNRDRDISMLDVALATSAAPTYFPIVSVNNVSSLCVDGGLWANNPTLVGVLEALSFFVGEGKKYNKFSILSIANISMDKGWKKSRNASIFGWKEKLITLPLNSQSKSIEDFLEITVRNKILPIEQYIRIPDPKLNKAQHDVISMDRADKKALTAIEDVALSHAHSWKNKEEIKHFFINKIRNWKFPINKNDYKE